jgi:hypothetical protein
VLVTILAGIVVWETRHILAPLPSGNRALLLACVGHRRRPWRCLGYSICALVRCRRPSPRHGCRRCRARIRPHFLFNSINAVLSLVRAEPARAETALQDMADLFRVLMRDNRDLAPLADEIELCRQYLELEQLRLGERLTVDWNLKSMPGDALVPPLVLQPLLENAVYHGIEPSSQPGHRVRSTCS